MSSLSQECESDEVPKVERRPWVTPTVIVAKAEGAANYSNIPDDGPFSVS